MKNLFKFTIADITEIAILSGLALIIDVLFGQAEAFNFALVPLYIISLRHGVFKGFIAGGIIFGLLTCIIDGYGFLCYPLEYLVAFGSIGLVGIFAKTVNKLFIAKGKYVLISYLFVVPAIILSGMIRFFCATIDSILIYEYSLAEAFAYNLTYVPSSTLISCVILCIMLPMIGVINRKIPTSYLSEK